MPLRTKENEIGVETTMLFQSSTDRIIQLAILAFAVIILIQYSTLFEEDYHIKLIDLYIYPWWRILTVLLVIFAALWCPEISLLLALVVVFYLSDMNTLISPITDL
jgi:hypothetical protein